MKSAVFITGWFMLGTALNAATVNLVQNSMNDATGASITAVSSDQWLNTGISHSTVTAPATSSTYRFTHWTNSSYPATVYRDAWGRSLNPISFTLLKNTTCTAHYLPATQDTDGDGIPDWYEIEYFGNLNQTATSDSDGDGITLQAEYTGGRHPLYGNSQQAGGVAYADSGMVTCNLAGYASYTLRSVPAGTVNQTAFAAPGTLLRTSDLSANTTFGYWTLDGVRQQDAWGVALSQISFTMGTANREAVAYLFSGDTDGDGVPDAYEQYYYGTLANGAVSDTDGDGITLLAERSGGTNPLYANTRQDGGVAWADSTLVTCNLSGYATYTLRSVPAGTVNQSAQAGPNVMITVPDLADNAFFAYWTLDGVRQQDAWGRALSTFGFTMTSSNREAVAYLLDGDSDDDGVPDAYEQRYYGTLANNAASDTDGDGATLSAEYAAGTSPIFGNAPQDGGVAWADSGMVTADLQADIVVEHASGFGITTGGAHRFGNVAVGSFTEHSLMIRNAGGKALTGLSLSLSGLDAAMFSVTSPPVVQLAHNGSTLFTVRFTPTATGPRNALLRIASNDVDENPFEIVLSGNEVTASPFEAWMSAANLPEGLSGPMASPYGDGVVNLQKFAFNLDPTKADSRYLLAGAGDLEGLPVVHRASNGRLRLEFIRRKASGNPGINYRAEFSSDLASWVDLTGLALVTAIDGIWERVVIEDVPPAGASKRFARVMVKQAASRTGPVMVVEQAGGIGLIDGLSEVDFGSAPPGTPTTLLFTIKNPGTANLTGLTITKDGTHATEFVVTANPSAPVAATGTTTFAVSFTPAAAGTRRAAIHIASNDPEAAQFDIALTGQAVSSTALQNWRQTHFGNVWNSGDGADLNDFDKDDIPNLVEFAFGLNPKQGSAGLLPRPKMSGNQFIVSFAQPAGVSGVTYGAEWSETLLNGDWTMIPDTGNSSQHVFSVPVGAKTKVFMRMKVAVP
jgi:hypothetical protein